MAVNPIRFLISASASVDAASNLVYVSGNIDCSRVFSGSALFLGGAPTPVEAISGTSPDEFGNSIITLRDSWPHASISNAYLIVFNTIEGIGNAINNLREIVSNISAIEDLVAVGLIKRLGENNYLILETTAIGESLITAVDAASQRTVLELGTSSTLNVTESDLDPEPNRVLKTNDYGVGIYGLSSSKFNPLPTGSVLGFGIATSATQAKFFLPINSTVPPVALSFGGGTYRVLDYSGVVIKTAIQAVDLSLGADSAYRFAEVIVSNLTGLTIGAPLMLQGSANTSTIEVLYVLPDPTPP